MPNIELVAFNSDPFIKQISQYCSQKQGAVWAKLACNQGIEWASESSNILLLRVE